MSRHGTSTNVSLIIYLRISWCLGTFEWGREKLKHLEVGALIIFRMSWTSGAVAGGAAAGGEGGGGGGGGGGEVVEVHSVLGLRWVGR